MTTDLKYSDFEVLLFDLGNTILPIDPELTVQAFKNLGFRENLSAPDEEMTNLLSKYQEGKISSEDFLFSLQENLPSQASNKQLIKAWNAMLLDFPQEHLLLLEKLQKTHQLILISNTNELHADCFEKKALEFGKSLPSYFDAVCYSHELGLNKPNVEIYEYVHSLYNLQGKKVLFLDDIAENLVAPQTLGWKTAQISKDKTILNFL